MLPIRLQIREGEPLKLPAGSDTARLRDNLLRATAGLPFDVFTIDSRGIRAGSAVGVIDTGTLQIELLPKVSAGANTGEDVQFLLNLLSASGLLPRLTIRHGHTALYARNAMEVIIRAFASDLSSRLSGGPPRRYSERSELSSVIRGRLDFTGIATRLPGSDHIVPVRYAPLQPDNPLSRLILATIETLMAVTHSARNRAILQHCQDVLGAVTRVPLTSTLVSSVRLTRFEADWSSVIEFATALVKGQSPNPVSAGPTSSFTLLFSLNDLFEAVLRKSLPLALQKESVSLCPRQQNLKLLRSLDRGHEVLELRPDYLFAPVEHSDSPILVADAKWKRLKEDSQSFGLKANDVYQLTTYMTRHGLSRGILFFPLDDWMRNQVKDLEYWFRTFILIGGQSIINLVGVDVPALVTKDNVRRYLALKTLKSAVLDTLTIVTSNNLQI